MTEEVALDERAKRMAGLAAGWRGIPTRPRQQSLLLPPGPPRAVRNALGLIDTHTPLRSLVSAAARGFSMTGLARATPFRRQPSGTAGALLRRLLPLLADALPREPAVMAVAIGQDRLDVLLMDPAGVPISFVKLATGDEAQWRMDDEAAVLELLRTPASALVHVPRLMIRGELDGRPLHAYEPLPDGPHRRPRPDPHLIREVGREVRERLADLPRPADVPAHYVPGHGDFTHRNLRMAGDGTLWLLDWEYARWMPPLADELRYWTTHHAFGLWLNAERAAARIVTLLRIRGSHEDIREAVAFPEFNRPREQAIRDAAGRLVAANGPG